MSKKGWIIGLMALMGVCGLRPAGAADTWALLVGVSKYESQQIATLRYPAKDAQSLQEALNDLKLGGLPKDHVRLLTDSQATAANIMGALDTFLKPNVKPGDRVVLFMAGHGVTKGVGVDAKSYLLPTDVKGLTTAALDASAVNFATVSSKLGELPASQFILFIDACREDPTPGRGIKGNLLSDVMSHSVQVVPQDTTRSVASVTFFACRVGQRAYEDSTLQHGVFTYWILNAIKEAAVPKKPDGAIDMGILSDYVEKQVKTWAQKASGDGGFEIDQTPEMLSSNVSAPVILLRVKRVYPDSALTPDPPRVLVAASPQDAQITINGDKVGAAPVTDTTTQAGEITVRVEAPGYEPFERSLHTFPGYAQQVVVELHPGVGTRAAGSTTKSDDLFQRASAAEGAGQFTLAESGYQLLLQSDPKYIPAYERLAALQFRAGQKNQDAIKTLVDLVGQAPSSVHAYSVLAEGYALYATRESIHGKGEQGEKDNKDQGKPKKKRGPFGIGRLEPRLERMSRFRTVCEGEAAVDFHVPKDPGEAVLLARKAAQVAMGLDANSPEAYRAQGFALMALDGKGQNKKEALSAFGKAAFLAPKDATCQYGLGYATRVYSMQEKNEDTRNAQLKEAVAALNEALKLRPNYYEAHRELAYCYHLMNDTPHATKEYEAANANRGAAGDPDEVAGLNVALGSLYMKQAQGADGDRKQQNQAASAGFLEDARELAPNQEVALRYLKSTGLGKELTDFLPHDLQDVFNRLNIRLPGIPGLPGVRLPGGLHF